MDLIREIAGWLFALLAALLFLTGVVGMFAPGLFKRPDEARPLPRWKFALGAWIAPVLPGTIAIMCWWL